MWPAYSMYLLYISTCYVWVFIVCFLATKKKKHVANANVLFVMLVLIIIVIYTYRYVWAAFDFNAYRIVWTGFQREFLLLLDQNLLFPLSRQLSITWHFILLSPLEGKVYIETRSIFTKASSSYWENPPVTGAFVKDCAHTSSLLRILPLPLSLDVVMRAWRTWLPAGSEASVSRSAGVRVRRLLRRSERSLNLASAWTSREPW